VVCGRLLNPKLKEGSEMDELVALVGEKTGLSEDMARTAVETVLGFVKDRLPGGIGDNLEGLLEGGEGGSDAGGLGGLGKLLD